MRKMEAGKIRRLRPTNQQVPARAVCQNLSPKLREVKQKKKGWFGRPRGSS